MIPSTEIILLGVLVGIVLASSLSHLFAVSYLGLSLFSAKLVCESCGEAQPILHRIPIIGSLFFTGKCHACGHSKPRLYPLLEFIIFGFSIWSFLVLKPILAIQISLLGFALMGVAYMDLKRWIIPNIFVEFVLACGVIGLMAGTVSPAQALFGVALASIVSLFIILPQRFGSGDGTLALGDVKLCLAVGLWLGWILATYVFFLASLLALLTWGISGLINGFSAQKRIPFGPFLALSTMIFGIGRVLDPLFVTHLLTFRF